MGSALALLMTNKGQPGPDPPLGLTKHGDERIDGGRGRRLALPLGQIQSKNPCGLKITRKKTKIKRVSAPRRHWGVSHGAPGLLMNKKLEETESKTRQKPQILRWGLVLGNQEAQKMLRTP